MDSGATNDDDPLAQMCRAYSVPLVATWEELDEATKHLWLKPRFMKDNPA